MVVVMMLSHKFGEPIKPLISSPLFATVISPDWRTMTLTNPANKFKVNLD